MCETLLCFSPALSVLIIMYGDFFLIFQSLWVERTALTLVQSLPGISRWFEVEKREVVSLCYYCMVLSIVYYFTVKQYKIYTP